MIPVLLFPDLSPTLVQIGPFAIRWYALAYIAGLVLGWQLGVALATWWFCRRNRIPILGFADRVAVCTPIGLGLGRVANFINDELWGRAAPESLPWAMIFPNDPLRLPRHPSQLYEMLLEGVVLFGVMFALSRSEAVRARFGCLTGAFLVGYGVARTTAEFFRQPDVYLGYLIGGATMGQLLSIPMLIAGAWLILRTR
jgi:phosphatidylglycerol:prolipoprotein diacylglycerol transferase